VPRVAWASIREFLSIPADVTGRGVTIAVVDGDFPPHPDIACDARRETLLVRTTPPDAEPHRLEAASRPWSGGEQASDALAERFRDPQAGVSYCALRLGWETGHASHLAEAIGGLHGDVAGRRNANFWARLGLVERIAGFALPLEPTTAQGPERVAHLWHQRADLAGRWLLWLERGGCAATPRP